MRKGLFCTFWGECRVIRPTIQEHALVGYAKVKIYLCKVVLGAEPRFDGICPLQSLTVVPETKCPVQNLGYHEF